MINRIEEWNRKTGTVRTNAAPVAAAIVVALGLVPTTGLADIGAAKTIASGLANPRGLGFAPNGDLYVAEGGQGGPGPCIQSSSQPPGVLRCYGETGALSRVLPEGGFKRILTGLPSVTLPDGTMEGGPVDVGFLGTAATVTVGLGGNPVTVRGSLPARGALLGTLLQVTPSGQYKVIADIAAHEAANNPAGGTVDSNPYGVLAQPGRRLVADAGANAVIEAGANGSTHTLVVLPPMPDGRQPVPTSVTEGPDGGLYVSLLTGFPFWRGTAAVMRVDSDGSHLTTWASGFTAIVDLAFDAGGAMYVLEVARGQAPPFPPPSPGIGIGRLLRVCPGGSPEVLLAGLTFPGGVAIGPDGAAYLTNFGTSKTLGEVLRLPIEPCQ